MTVSLSATAGDAIQGWAAVVPELACVDFDESIRFYTQSLGFVVLYSRPNFAYLNLEAVQLMLEQAPGDWPTGELVTPYGRGVNLQMVVRDAPAMAERLEQSGISLFLPLRERWYVAGAIESGQLEFIVQDPSGYLLRFMSPIGERPHDHA